MAAGRLLLPSWMPALDGDGFPIPNAKVFFYLNLTTTLAPVYEDEALSIPLANPVEANSSGRFPAVWADGDALYSASVEAPYGPAGVPFTYDNLSASLGADILIAGAAEAAANESVASAAAAAAALAEIEDIVANAPDAPSVVNKANRSLDNVTTTDFSEKDILVSSGDTEQPLNEVVPLYLISNGAVPNVFNSVAGAANVAALNKAVPAGQAIDGKGAVFAIDGRWTATVTPNLKNATLRQIATTGTDRDYTVVIDGKNGFSLENVVIDLNDIQARAGVTFGNTAAIHVKNCSGFTIKDSRVINGGGHTGWLFENCSDFDFIDSDARDFDAIFAVAPTDDVACGVSFLNCTNGRIRGGRPGNISASWTGQPAPRRLFARGMSFSGCSYMYVRDTQVDLVDQGFDITGQPNHDLYFWNIGATDCSTFGFKVSNRSYNIFVDGFQIDRPGWAGTHVTSSLSTGATPYVQNIRFSGGRVRNVGENSIYTSVDGRNAYQIVHTGLTPGYPAGVFYDGCTWTDDQTVKTTDIPFAQRGTITPRTPTTTIPMNQIGPSCAGEGLAVGGTPQSGMNFPNATVTGTASTVALANNTFVPLVFSVTVYDPSVMLDSVNGRLYAPVDGDYDVGCVVTFANAAAGIGETFLYKNGSEIGANYRASARLDPTFNTKVEMVRPIRLKQGEYVSIQGRQQSGSSMNIALSNSLFWLRKRNTFS